jgi:hypothetical protein
MRWRDISTFLMGTAIVVIDALLFKPIYRYVNDRSRRRP